MTILTIFLIVLFSFLIAALDKEMRGWDTFISLEALLKNMVTSLRAVSELQNPAIRQRHWRHLMAATKVKIVIDENTVLDDLLHLNLHLFEDEVGVRLVSKF